MKISELHVANSRRGRSWPSIKLETLECRTLLSGWSTVDAVPGDNMVMGMAADHSGNVYAVGQGIIRESSNGGASWTTIVQSTSMHFNAVATDGAGDVYVSGANTGGHWIIQERPAGQSAFSTVDDVASGNSNGLATDAAGDVFAVGRVVLPSGKNSTSTYWEVRERKAAGLAFAAVDQIPVSTIGDLPRAVSVIDSGASKGVYVVGGFTASTPGSSQWLVRKSADGGTTWSQVDNFRYDSTASARSEAYGVVGDSAGHVYVLGIGFKATITGYTKNHAPIYGYTEHWIARVSGDGGATWTISDDYLSPLAGAEALSVGADLAGNIYAVGDGQDASGVWHGIIRTNTGGTWTTADDDTDNGGPEWQAFTADPSTGAFYVGGWDLNGWLIRSVPGPAAPTATPATAAAAVFSPTQITTATDPTDIFHHRKHRR